MARMSWKYCWGIWVTWHKWKSVTWCWFGDLTLKSNELIYNPSSKICKPQALKITFYRIIVSVEFSFKLGHLICEQLFYDFGIW